MSTVDVSLERHNVVTSTQTGTYTADNLPYGLGPRVPMFVVSPWSKGGFVCSQVFDHTSVLQFIEKRFGVMETNISPWRRAICGDLTSALDFSKSDATLPTLPSTQAYVAQADLQCSRASSQTAPASTAQQVVTAQEPGTRPARALPYELHVPASSRPALRADVREYRHARLRALLGSGSIRVTRPRCRAAIRSKRASS